MRRMQADQHNKAIREHMQTVSDTWRIDRNQLPPWADDTLVFEVNTFWQVFKNLISITITIE